MGCATSLLAGLQVDERRNVNVGDLRRSDAGAVLHVRGMGNKHRSTTHRTRADRRPRGPAPNAGGPVPPKADDERRASRQPAAPPHRFPSSSAMMETGSTAGHSSTECSGPSRRPSGTAKGPLGALVRSITGFFRSPRRWGCFATSVSAAVSAASVAAVGDDHGGTGGLGVRGAQLGHDQAERVRGIGASLTPRGPGHRHRSGPCAGRRAEPAPSRTPSTVSAGKLSQARRPARDMPGCTSCGLMTRERPRRGTSSPAINACLSMPPRRQCFMEP